ncbi:hypothetical protein Q7P37_000113 [Cladosporium fusiforme]
MSSNSSGSDASAHYKDVAEGAGPGDAGAPDVIVEDVDGDDYFSAYTRGDDDDEEPSTLADELEGEEMEGEDMAVNDATLPGDMDMDMADDDIPQLEYNRPATPDEAAPDMPPEPSTPVAASPLASPLDSGSIPDDTPSVLGSPASTPSRGLPSTPRRFPSRTASGALQPFERRFEGRPTLSPSPSSRGASPAFLSPHSRQISLSSQLSPGGSSQGDAASDEPPQAPWEVVRWTKLRKITGQVFSEIGKRNFGRPTCLAVSALIAVGTSKGLVLGFDYHQTLKIIIGQGTKAAECGSVTSLAIAADYSTIAAGHANGYIFTWEINRPARPFLQIPPVSSKVIQQSQHPDGHVADRAILHVGFLGTRHTALVSADSGGMAFSHLATRGLGPVTRTIKTTRLLGRYPSADPQTERSRKPSSVLAFSPLPLGNVEQQTDNMGLTALLTPYLLVIVSTTPIAQTQHKSARPKDVSPHSTLSGCLAWFPAVKLKASSKDSEKQVSDTKLAYCWSNVLTVLDVKVAPQEDAADSNQQPAKLEFNARSRWRAEEAIVAVQWLGRSVLGVLTISQRMLILEDGGLQVTDSIDLLPRHLYHQDPFSRQLHNVVEQLNPEDPSMHGVVADAFYMSFKAYKGRTFLLGFNDLTVGSLSNWADRLVALMETGDHIAAIRLATDYYSGVANNVTVGLPDDDETRHEMVRERLLAMLTASMDYTFAQHDDQRDDRLKELAVVCFEACISMQETEFLFNKFFEAFQDADDEDLFVSTLEPFVLDGDLTFLPPDVVKSVVAHFISQNEAARLEELLCWLEPSSFDLEEITMLCRQHNLYDALIHVWTRAIGDFVTPLVDLLQLVKMLESGSDAEHSMDNPFFVAAMRVFPYLAFAFTSRRYPNGELMGDDEASHAKADLYEYLFSGRSVAWPPGSKRVFHTESDPQDEPAFPYLVLLLRFDAASFMSMLNEAFEDTFLNESDEESQSNGSAQTNGITSRSGYKMTRQHIVSILLDAMEQNNFDAEETIFLDIFIARSLPKYPAQLVLSGSLLNRVLQRLCQVPSEELREDCELSAEYLLSAYQPPDSGALIESLKEANFYRVLKTVYRRQRLYTELLETYFEDDEDKDGVFDCIASSLLPGNGLGQKQVQSFKDCIVDHAAELADISVIQTARTLLATAADLLEPCAKALPDSYQQFTFLRTLLEPKLVGEETSLRSQQAIPDNVRHTFQERYVQLMCAHEPGHVADYVGLLQSGDLQLDRVLPAMESSGVIDAAVVLLARDGLARDAMHRLVAHMQSQQHALTSLLEAADQSPDVEATRETAEDLVEAVQKYTKVGIWLCQGQTATAERRPRPRANLSKDLDENELDIDEFLWLNLIDAVVQVSKETSPSLQHIEDHPSEINPATLTPNSIRLALRSNQPAPPSLSDLRSVLADIFSAYAFEQNVLALATDLLGSDVFADIDDAHTRRQRGWRPRSQACELCKRRAWGTGIGEVVWDEWLGRELGRERRRVEVRVERSGGVEARRRSRGKGRAQEVLSSPGAAAAAGDVGERIEDVMSGGIGGGGDRGRLALVVFACRHVFHQVCLDEDGVRKNGRVEREVTGGRCILVRSCCRDCAYPPSVGPSYQRNQPLTPAIPASHPPRAPKRQQNSVQAGSTHSPVFPLSHPRPSDRANRSANELLASINQTNTMATLLKRQSDDGLDMDQSYNHYDSQRCYEEGRCSWWWSNTGSAVRYTIVAVLFFLLFAYFLGGYWHARHRVRKNLPPLAYHRWMVKRRAYPRYWGGAPMYAHNQQQHPYYYANPAAQQQQQQHPDYYGMQGSRHAPPPPAYHAGDAPPPVYQPPPQGSTKVAADQSYNNEVRGRAARRRRRLLGPRLLGLGSEGRKAEQE